MAELTKEAACREIAERHGWILMNGRDCIGWKVVAALREAYDAGAKAQREEDAELVEQYYMRDHNVDVNICGWIAAAIRQGRH